jgi:hypothetical protein
MKTTINSRAGKISLVGSMVLTAIFVSLVAMFLPAIRRPSHRHPHDSCVNNEKQLGIAFRGFGIDIGGFPMLLSNTNSTANTPELVDARPNQTEASSAQ